MGLNVTWNQEDGLCISKSSHSKLYESSLEGKNDLNMSYKAHIIIENVEVNGVKISNDLVVYPLLNFKNITYFPMTWKFMVDEFNTTNLTRLMNGVIHQVYR